MADGGVFRILGIGLVTDDLPRARAFYVGALGFEPVASGVRTGDEVAAPAAARASARFERLRLGAEEIELEQFDPPGRPYPEPRRADDPWFQHFAVAVGDMGAAHLSAVRGGAAAVSEGGPQTLPPRTGSVTAWKFRDPEGHPLELSSAPGSAWARTSGGRVFLGVDHTALAVSDLAASLDFYTRLGLRPGERLLNQGPEQDRLDGLAGVQLDIAVLTTPEPGPHIELLHYRTPPSRNPRAGFAPNDVAATRTRFEVRGLEALLAAAAPEVTAADAVGSRAWVRDPDGHLLELREGCTGASGTG